MAVSALLALALSPLWLVGPAGAHPFLVQTEPGPGVTLRNPPSTIRIGFTEPVVLEGSTLRLEDFEGHPVALGPLRTPEEGPGLAADIEGTTGGDVYTVEWIVLGDDGHSSSGEFRFGVAGPNGAPPKHAETLTATGGPADQAAASDGPVRIVLRWLGLLGATVLVGGAVLLARLRGRPDEAAWAVVAARWTRLARAAWALTLVGSLGAVVAIAGAGAGGLRLPVLLASSTGVIAVARLVGVVVTGVPGLLRRPGPGRDQFLAVSGAFFLGAEAVGGHMTAITGSGRVPAMVAQGAHLIASAVWVGGLGVLVYAVAGMASRTRPEGWRTALVAFSPVAAISAAVVIGTGVVASIREVEHRYFLLWSAYGRFLLAKWVLVAAMLVLGGLGGRVFLRRRAGTARRRTPPVGTLLRAEAVIGAVVLVFAATLVGVAQGRGQPLPAQEGSVLAGPAFANTVVGGGLVRVALSPARPGRNRLTALLASPVEAAGAGGVEPSAPVPGEDEAMSVTLKCSCAAEPVEAELAKAAGAWRADVDLPAEGIWQATLRVGDGSSLAPVTLRVDDGDYPGAPAWEISSIGDLSAAAARRCRSFQLGLVLALGFVNAKGGVDGRKVIVRAGDDAGDPARARALAEEAGHANLAVPCGPTAGVTAPILRERMPVVIADALAPFVTGERIFRLSGDPLAEGWAAGRALARTGFVARPDAPRRMSVVVQGGDAGGDRFVAGVKAALALDPGDAEAVEGTRPQSTADVEVDVRTHEPGTPLLPVVREALVGDRYSAAFLAVEPVALGQALDQLSDTEIISTPAVFTASRSFDETFLRSSKIGRRGDIKMLGEVAPDSADSLLYTALTTAIFPGEQPAIDGFRGFMAGKAIVAGLARGSSTERLTEGLAVVNLNSEVEGGPRDGPVSGWSPAAPSAGSWRFLLFKGSFIPTGLYKGNPVDPGRYFPEGGAWSRVMTGNIGLCGPQLSVEGPPPPCEPLPRK